MTALAPTEAAALTAAIVRPHSRKAMERCRGRMGALLESARERAARPSNVFPLRAAGSAMTGAQIRAAATEEKAKAEAALEWLDAVCSACRRCGGPQ